MHSLGSKWNHKTRYVLELFHCCSQANCPRNSSNSGRRMRSRLHQLHAIRCSHRAPSSIADRDRKALVLRPLLHLMPGDVQPSSYPRMMFVHIPVRWEKQGTAETILAGEHMFFWGLCACTHIICYAYICTYHLYDNGRFDFQSTTAVIRSKQTYKMAYNTIIGPIEGAMACYGGFRQ